MDTRPFKYYRKGEMPTAVEFNRLVRLVVGMARSLYIQGFSDSTGFHTRRTPDFDGSEDIRIFAVQSEATGDGVYTCYEQTLDATEWDDTAGDAKFDDLDAEDVEVLNLDEAYPESTYYASLSAGDLLSAWQMMDDEGTLRWIGTPFIKRPINETFGVTRSAKINTVGTTTLTCKLLDSAGAVIGGDITVKFREHLGTNSLSAFTVWPDLRVNDYVLVAKDRDNVWYFYGTVDDTTDCDA